MSKTTQTPEHLAGSIRRIRLQNFMSYNDVEFFPGPRLNLVLGPNGSGKSAIVSAIVLGLGGKASTLGRAEDLKSYIKHERGSAFIEIELQNKKPRHRNIVIKRVLNQNSSVWFINGKQCPKSKIDEIAKEYSIQVGNMTQFLPQEKVSHFGTLKPPEILRMTEFVYGGEKMINIHNSLLGYQKELAKLQATQEERRSQIEALESRIARLETLLSSHKQLENLRQTLDVAQMKYPILNWREATIQLHSLQDKLRMITERITHIHDTLITPILERRGDLSTLKSQNKSEAGVINKQIHAMMKTISERENDQRKLIFGITQISDKMRNLQSLHDSQLHEIERQRTELQEMKADLDKQQPPATIQTEIKKLKTEVQQFTEKEAAAHTEFTTWQLKSDEINDRIIQKSKRLKALESTDNILELKIRHLCDPGSHARGTSNFLTRVLPIALKLPKFISENQSKFRGKVYAPLGAYITPKKNSGVILDNFISTSQYLTIVCTHPKDMAQLATTKNFSVHLVQELDPDLDIIQRAMDNQQTFNPSAIPKLGNRIPHGDLNKFGLEAYIDDLYDAPPIIKMALRNMLSLHVIPVAQPGKLTEYGIASSAMYKANIQRLALMSSGAWNKSSFKSASSFGFEHYRVKDGPFSRIFRMISGKQDSLTPSITATEIKKLKQEIDTLSEEIKVPASKAAIIKSQKLTELRAERKRREHLIQKLQFSISTFERNLNSYTRASNDIAQLEKEITSSSLDEKRKKLSAKQDQILQRLCDLRIKYTQALTNLTKSLKLSHQSLARSHQLEVAKQILDDKFVLIQDFYRTLKGSKQDLLQKMKGIQSRITKIESTIRSNHQFLKAVGRVTGDNSSSQGSQGSGTNFGSISIGTNLNPSFSLDEYHLADWLPVDPAIQRVWNSLPNSFDELGPTMASLQAQVNDLDDSEFFDLRTRLEESRNQYSNIKSIQAKSEKKLIELKKKTQSTAISWTSRLEDLIEIIREYIRKAFRSMKCVGDVKLVNNHPEDYASYGIDIFVSFRKGRELTSFSSNRLSGGERSVTTMVYILSLQTASSTRCPFRVVDEINQGMDERNERMIFDLVLEAVTVPEYRTQYFMISPKLLSFLNLDNPAISVHIVFNGNFAYAKGKKTVPGQSKPKKYVIPKINHPSKTPQLPDINDDLNDSDSD